MGFLVTGVLILVRCRRGDLPHLRSLAYVSIVTALGSAFFHASETFVGRVLDWFGMYLGSAYMLTENVQRWRPSRPWVQRTVFWTTVGALLSTMILLPDLAQTLYIAQMAFCCVVLECILLRRQGSRTRYRALFVYWAVFVVAYAAWWLDKSKAVCDPANHVLSGHAVWHLLDAVALYWLFVFYRQFPSLR